MNWRIRIKICKTLGNAVENKEEKTREHITDVANEVDIENVENLTQTENLLTNATNALGTEMMYNHLDWQQFYKHINEQNMGEYRELYYKMYQAYVQLMNQPQIQPVIVLENHPPEVVNTSGFTPQAIDQVNRATALIEEYEDKDRDYESEEHEGIDREQACNDFIAFSSILARNFKTILISFNSQMILDLFASSWLIVHDMIILHW